MLGYYGLGCDPVSVIRANPFTNERAPCKTCIEFDEIGKTCEKKILSYRSRASKYSNLFDFCISASFDYCHCHDFFINAKHSRIPLPVNFHLLPYSPANIKGKTMILHAPTRKGFKGTDTIIEAIKILKKKRNDFEFNVIDNLSYDDYKKKIEKCDIFIDQIHSHGPGMSALENLAMGKIVFSGCSEQYKAWMPFSKKSPIIHASDSAEKLALQLSNILDNKLYFHEFAEKGRSYIEKNHDYIKVAEQFVQLWKS